MLSQMNTGEPFCITFVSVNQKQNTGGEIVKLNNVRKNQAGNIQELPSGNTASSAPDKHTNPQHAAHGTINVKCADNSLYKVHTRLILSFNKQEVSL